SAEGVAHRHPRLHRRQCRHYSAGFDGSPRFHLARRRCQSACALRHAARAALGGTAAGAGGMSAMTAEREDVPQADEPWPLPEGWAWQELHRFLGNGQTTVDPRREPKLTFVLYSVPSFETGVPEKLL